MRLIRDDVKFFFLPNREVGATVGATDPVNEAIIYLKVSLTFSQLDPGDVRCILPRRDNSILHWANPDISNYASSREKNNKHQNPQKL